MGKSINDYLGEAVNTLLCHNILMHYESFRNNKVLYIINKLIIEYETYTQHLVKVEILTLSIIKYRSWWSR